MPNIIEGDTPTENKDWEMSASGEHRVFVVQKRGSAISSKALLAAAIIAAASSGATWLAKSAWSGIAAELTSGKADAAVVDTIKVDVAALKKDVAALQTDATEIKTEQKAASRLLHRMARKLKVEE